MNYPYYNQVANANINQSQQQISNPQQVSQQIQPMSYQNTMMSSPTLFPQPMGSVYSLTTASEIGNVPAGMNMSVGLCLQENVMYIKALQNGSPMLLGYRLSPIEGQPNGSMEDTEKDNKKILDILEGYNEKFQLMESQIAKLKEKIGGKAEWQL